MPITHYIPGTLERCQELSRLLFALGRPETLDDDDENGTKYMFPIVELEDNASGYNYAIGVDKSLRRSIKKGIKGNERLKKLLDDYYDADEKQEMYDRIDGERDITVQFLLSKTLRDEMVPAKKAGEFIINRSFSDSDYVPS